MTVPTAELRPPQVAGWRAGRDWPAGIACALTALFLRLWHLASLRALPTFDGLIMDEAYHDTWARGLAGGDWLGQEAFFRAPLYPYLLGALYAIHEPGGLAPRLFQCVLGSVSVLLVHRIGLRLAGPAGAAVAALLTALCWPLIHFDNELLITGLEVLTGLAALALLMRADEQAGRPALLFAGGVALGLAAIARPNFLVAAVPALFWAAARPGLRGRARVMPALAVAAGLAVPILPVTIRNAVVGGDLVLISSQGGVNFYIGNNPHADGTTAVVPGTRPTWQGGYEDTIEIARQAHGSDLRPSGVSRYWFGQGLRFWADAPLEALRITWKKGVLFFSGIEVSNNKDLTFFRSLSPVLSLPLPGSGLIVPLGLAGWLTALAARSASRRSLALPAAFAAAYALSIIGFFVTSRYRAPVLPILALGAGLLIDRVLSMAAAGAWRRAAITLAGAGALAWGLNVNWYGYRDEPGQGHYALGVSCLVKQRHDEAVAHFDRSIALGGPYRYEALRGKGEALAATGRVTEAYEVLAEAVRARPDSTDALSSLLGVASLAGRLEEARALAREAAPATPAHQAELHFLLGSIAQAAGRPVQAEGDYRRALSWRAEHLGARVNLALLLRGSGRLDESLQQLLAAERLSPASPIVHLNLAKHYLFVGDRARAVHHADLAERAGGSLDAEFARALAATPGLGR